jgi:hypothetical protein
VYTCRIVANDKWFPTTQHAYVAGLQSCALEIAALCWEANNIKVDDSIDRYRRRVSLQEEAAEKCNRMMLLIEIAKPLFHLKSTRVRYWIGLARDLRAMIRAWTEKDAKRLLPKA